MKKYTYIVKGLDSETRAQDAQRVISRAFGEDCKAFVDTENERISLELEARLSASEVELLLEGALAAVEITLVCSEGTKRFRYTEKRTRVAKMPVALAASLIAIAMVASILFTFAACGFAPLNQNGGGGEAQTSPINPTPLPEEQVEELEIPDYIKDLIKLDDAFKDYSYSGIDEEAMADAVLKAYIAATGDMFAEYMNAEEYEDYNSESTGEFVGVGVSIVNSSVELSGYKYKVLEIISVFNDSPALEAGLKVGDLIMYVGVGEDQILVDALGYTEALDMLLGEAGTNAEFIVYRPDKSADIGYDVLEFSITRRKVTTQSVYFNVSETDSRVGIVNITSFDLTTAVQFTEAVDTLLASGCEYFVFDVRNNPGGSLLSIEAVLSYFLDEGDLIIGIEYGNGYKEADYVSVKNYGSAYAGYNVSRSDIGKYKDLDFVVLTNGNTASAAELFTATMRDYNLAPVIGETTYGKGCMQTILPLDDYGLEGGLRVTTAMYFSKSYHIYHEIGIVPDIEVTLTEEAMEYNFFLLPENLDNQLQAALAELLK